MLRFIFGFFGFDFGVCWLKGGRCLKYNNNKNFLQLRIAEVVVVDLVSLLHILSVIIFNLML